MLSIGKRANVLAPCLTLIVLFANAAIAESGAATETNLYGEGVVLTTPALDRTQDVRVAGSMLRFRRTLIDGFILGLSHELYREQLSGDRDTHFERQRVFAGLGFALSLGSITLFAEARGMFEKRSDTTDLSDRPDSPTNSSAFFEQTWKPYFAPRLLGVFTHGFETGIVSHSIYSENLIERTTLSYGSSSGIYRIGSHWPRRTETSTESVVSSAFELEPAYQYAFDSRGARHDFGNHGELRVGPRIILSTAIFSGSFSLQRVWRVTGGEFLPGWRAFLSIGGSF